MVKQPSNDDKKFRVQSLARGLSVLTEIARNRQGLSAKEISERLGLARQTTYHLLHTLREMAFVERGAGHRYTLGLATGTLVEAFAEQLAPPDWLMPHLSELAFETGEPCSVVGWRDGDVVVLAHVPGEHTVRVSNVHVGQVGQAHARASGKLLLAHAPQDTRDRYFDGYDYEQLTENTITDPTILDAELENILEAGYAIDNEGFARGVCCVAALVEVGASHFTFSVSAPAERFHERREHYIAAVCRIAKQAST